MDESQLDVEVVIGGIVTGSPRKSGLVSETRRDNDTAHPFLSLDLNSSALKCKENQSSSPPPSSPPSLAFGMSSPPSSVALGSSPFKSATLNSSPIKPVASSRTNNANLQVPAAVKRVAQVEGNGDEHAGLRELSDGATDASVKYALYGSFTHALLVGRSRAAGVTPLPPSAAGLGAKPSQFVALPNHAKHVSRLHAIVEYLPFPTSVTQNDDEDVANSDALSRGTFVVRILGQNGLIVEGKRRAEGQVLRLKPGYVMDFFGVAARFDVSPQAVRPQYVSALVKPVRPIVPAPRSPTKSNKSASRKSRLSMSSTVTDSPIPSPFASSSSPEKPAQRSNGDTTMDPDTTRMREPSSPTLSRRAAQSSTNKRVRPAQLASEESESDAEEALPVRKKKHARFAVPSRTPEDVGSESDLTPTPTPSPPGSPVIEAAAAPPVAFVALKTRPSRSMPPPSVPASSRLSSPAVVSSLADAEAKALIVRAREAVARLAPSYDLEGLLAGAIVFHRTATISATEAVRSVLAGTPGLLLGQAGVHAPVGGASTKNGEVIHGWGNGEGWTRVVRKVWRETLEGVLHGSECFGVIQRAGKDASGAPLENWHYYDKEKDPDPERAANLGVFAKPLRAALKTHKPIFWKKSAYGHAASETAMPYLGSESQVGSASPLSEVIPLASSSLSTSSSTAAAAGKAEKRKQGGAGTSLRVNNVIWAETQLDTEKETTYDRHGDEDYRGD